MFENKQLTIFPLRKPVNGTVNREIPPKARTEFFYTWSELKYSKNLVIYISKDYFLTFFNKFWRIFKMYEHSSESSNNERQLQINNSKLE